MKAEKIKKIALTTLATAPIVIFLFVSLYWSDDVGIKGKGFIENIVLGNNESFFGDKNFTIKEADYSDSRNISRILDRTKNIYLPIEIDADNKYLFSNTSAISIPLELKEALRDDSLLRVVYNKDDKKLDFVIPGNSMTINDQKIQTADIAIYTIKNLAPDSIVKIGESKTVDLNNYINNSYVSLKVLKKDKIYQYTSSDRNLLDPSVASFENVMWASQAFDCSDGMNGAAKFTMYLSNDAINGKQSLHLSSNNHNACTNKTFPVKGSSAKLYKLSFDYKSLAGQKVQYYYSLQDSAEKKINEKNQTIVAPLNTWGSAQTLLDSKGKDFSSVQIFLYSPSDGTKEVGNLYDNIALTELSNVQELTLENVGFNDSGITLANNITLKEGDNPLDLIVNNTQNLLDPASASFENGLWTDQALDCSNGIKGKAVFSIGLAKDASDGKQSLLLDSENHNACTNRTFPVKIDSGKLYRLSFDYKNIKGGKVGYYYALKDAENNVIKEKSEFFGAEDNNWNHVETVIDSENNDFSNIQIFFYAPSDGSKEVENLYDMIKFEEYVPKDANSYFLYVQQNLEEINPFRSIEYKEANVFQDRIIIHGAKDGFFLESSLKYDPLRRAYVFPYEMPKNAPSFSDKYYAPDKDINRQAIRPEVRDFINNGMISFFGTGFISKNENGSIRNDNIPGVSLQDTLFSFPISEKNQFKAENNVNSWWISVDDLCRGRNLCHKNADGTFEINLVIESIWLKVIYLSLLVPLIVTFILLYRFIRKRKIKDIITRKSCEEIFDHFSKIKDKKSFRMNYAGELLGKMKTGISKITSKLKKKIKTPKEPKIIIFYDKK